MPGFHVPEYPNITNYGQNPDALLAAIDGIATDKEWGKVPLLAADADYHAFLVHALRITDEELQAYCADFLNDQKFHDAFAPKLVECEQSGDAGDLRLNSFVPYVAARALKPEVIIETGVAAGKSSALFLLALAHNGNGRLISIDLPNDGSVMADGATTSTGSHETGWLVPEYLRPQWELVLEDSKVALPRILSGLSSVGVFMHDSLHTYEHVQFEFGAVFPKLGPSSVLMCDNLEGEAGKAFSDILASKGVQGYAYRNFGTVRL